MTALHEPLAARTLEQVARDEPHIFLPGVSWAFYKTMVREIGARRSLRITFDRGDMELMTVSGRHDSYKHLLRRLFDTLTLELGMAIKGFGACTLMRDDLERALEADEWYYTFNEPLVRGKQDLDLSVDPPPDLAIEIEVSRTILNKMDVYAAMKVPEIWRFNGISLKAYVLRAYGKYEQVERSPTFPNVPLDELVRFVNLSTEMSETDLIRLFSEWVREHILPSWKRPAAS